MREVPYTIGVPMAGPARSFCAQSEAGGRVSDAADRMRERRNAVRPPRRTCRAAFRRGESGLLQWSMKAGRPRAARAVGGAAPACAAHGAAEVMAS